MKYAIIVGFGLAGFHLARQLQKQGKEFVIISDRAKGASRNAGGVLNPTILKRYTIAWNGVAFFDHALPTYRWRGWLRGSGISLVGRGRRGRVGRDKRR